MRIEIAEFKDEKLGPARRAAAQSSACILAVSLDQEYHEGANWDETVRIVNENFAFCVVVIVDELHGYTDAMKSPLSVLQDEVALQAEINTKKIAASKRGAAWAEKIQARWRGEGVDPKVAPHIPKFTIPFLITHWVDWTECSHYLLKRQYIDAMYNQHKPTHAISDSDCLSTYGSPKVKNLHTVVDIVVHNFVGGFLRQLERETSSVETVEFDLQTASRLSMEYTLIELAMVEMCRARCYPEKVAEKIFNFEQVYLTYFFGQNSTNKNVFNCFKKFCSPNFGFLSLVKITKQPTLSQSSSQKQRNNPVDFTEQKTVQLSPKVRDKQISYLHGAEGQDSILDYTLKRNISDEHITLIQPNAMFGNNHSVSVERKETTVFDAH